MANWRSFGDGMLNCRRSMLKTWCNYSNPARFHHSTSGGGGLLPPVVSSSSEYYLRLGDRLFGALKKCATFPSIQHCFSSSGEATTDVVVVDQEEAVRGPLPLGSAPCLMLPAGSGLVANGERFKLVTMEGERDYYRFFSLMEKKVVKMKTNLMFPWQRELLPPHDAICFGSSRGWLSFIHPQNCSLYLFNPFIHSYLPSLPLPPIETLPSFISTLRYCRNSNIHNSSSSSSSSIATNYNNNIVTEFTIWNQVSPISSQDLSHSHFFKKIVLSSDPSPFPSNHLHNEKKNSSDSTVMVIQGYGENKLAFCRIGDTAWTALDGADKSYQDVVYFSKDQKFYALSTNYNCVEAWDLRNPASPENGLIISHLPPWVHPTMDIHQTQLRRCCSPDRYLVESLGELLMVVRYYSHNGDYHPEIIFEDYSQPKKTIMFDVYKLDFVNKDWVLLPTLGDDRALFIGLNDSVSVPAIDFPGLAMNCVYFTSPHVQFPQDSHDLGIFNLKDNTITPIYHYDLKIQLPSPWIVPAAQQ